MARRRDASREQEDVRAFFALELDAAAREAARARAQRLRALPGGDDMRWVKAENLHVTLRFLGDVAQARIEGLVEEVRERIADIAPFALRLGAVRSFPSPRRPRVVVCEIAPPEPLERLAAAVEAGVVAEGFEAETRRFRPHLTLGRVRPSGSPPDVTAADTPVSDAFPVTEIVLFRSELHPQGARSSALARLPLTGGGSGSSSSGARSSSPL